MSEAERRLRGAATEWSQGGEHQRQLSADLATMFAKIDELAQLNAEARRLVGARRRTRAPGT